MCSPCPAVPGSCCSGASRERSGCWQEKHQGALAFKIRSQEWCDYLPSDKNSIFSAKAAEGIWPLQSSCPRELLSASGGCGRPQGAGLLAPSPAHQESLLAFPGPVFTLQPGAEGFSEIAPDCSCSGARRESAPACPVLGTTTAPVR